MSVSPVSAQAVRVTYQTANGTAVAGQDYAAASGVLTIPPQAASATIAVPLLHDPLYEPAETFTVTLSNASAPVTIARATGQATIPDDPRVDIDPALAGVYLAGLNARPDESDSLVIGNPHAVAVTARLTWVKPDGTDARRGWFPSNQHPASARLPGPRRHQDREDPQDVDAGRVDSTAGVRARQAE